MNQGIRSFRADDARAALAAVRAALGPEAVIVATREVGGLLGRRQVEVTAGRPEDVAAATSVPVGADALARALRPRPLTGPRPAPQDPGDAPPAPRAPLSREAVLLFRCLVTRGMEETLALDLVRHAFAAPGGDPVARLREATAALLPAAPAPWLARPGRRVLALVGPTGAGKTTSIAKIAARAVLDSRRKVALITVDTYRIGASEQLARFGAILRVPVAIARDRAEIVRALEAASGTDLVLVDTAGRSAPDAAARQARLLRTVPGVELVLVASAATGHRDLAAVAERYRGLDVGELLVTKTDEAAAPAGVLSAVVRAGCPVCAVANGQRVPEDLYAGAVPDLVNLVLGGRRSGAAGRT